MIYRILIIKIKKSTLLKPLHINVIPELHDSRKLTTVLLKEFEQFVRTSI
jgi:hypothetical protein